MRAAAQNLRMTPSAISQHINQLENELGIILIYRTTRKISLSEAGERYYQHGKKMLMIAQDAEDAIHEVKHLLEGELRVSAPTGLATWPLAQALKGIMEANAGLRVTILAHDKLIDLVSEHIDIAIRVGEPKESNFIYHPLGQINKSIYASPDYLQQHGIPNITSDLKQHFWLGLLTQDKFSYINITLDNRDTFQYQPNFRMRFNDMNALCSHVQAGYGMALLPDMEVKHLFETGQLIKVLPEWQSKSHQLYALTINRIQTYKVQILIATLREFFS